MYQKILAGEGVKAADLSKVLDAIFPKVHGSFDYRDSQGRHDMLEMGNTFYADGKMTIPQAEVDKAAAGIYKLQEDGSFTLKDKEVVQASLLAADRVIKQINNPEAVKTLLEAYGLAKADDKTQDVVTPGNVAAMLLASGNQSAYTHTTDGPATTFSDKYDLGNKIPEAVSALIAEKLVMDNVEFQQGSSADALNRLKGNVRDFSKEMNNGLLEKTARFSSF